MKKVLWHFRQRKPVHYRVWGRMTPLRTYIRMNTEIHG